MPRQMTILEQNIEIVNRKHQPKCPDCKGDTLWRGKICLACKIREKLFPRKDPQNIVCEVVDDYFHNVRHFNPKYDIEMQLRSAVRSELWALHQRVEANAIPLQDENNEILPCGYETDELSPDGVAMVEHDWKTLFELFRSHPKVKGDEELEFLLMAIEDGAEKAPEMAQQTGIAVERIYELLKKLRKYYPIVKKQFQKGTEILK